jgi:5-oxoprolinase (ATP-hydrolysing) subunit A
MTRPVKHCIDLNADVGEGFADAAVLRFVSSANVACGAHAGDEETARATIRLARSLAVRIGAHPGYPDRAGFGRSVTTRDPQAIEGFVAEQIDWLLRLAADEGASVAHVKPHGALYNLAASDPDVAGAVARATRAAAPGTCLVLRAASPALATARAAGLSVLAEGFVDRAYLRDGSLAPRERAGAVLDDPKLAAARAVDIAAGRPIAALDGGQILVSAETLCLHGDGTRAGEIAERVARALRAHGIEIAAPGAASG